jgi:hypothetical protein
VAAGGAGFAVALGAGCGAGELQPPSVRATIGHIASVRIFMPRI